MKNQLTSTTASGSVVSPTASDPSNTASASYIKISLLISCIFSQNFLEL